MNNTTLALGDSRHLAWFSRSAAGRFDGFANTAPGKTLNGMSKSD